MIRFAAGVLAAAVAMYAWGFLFWGATSIPYSAWKKTTDDEAAGRAILEYFPASGTYHVPAMDQDPGQRAKLFESGPVAMVHLTSREGRPEFDPGIMIRGFVLYVVGAALVAALLWASSSALPGYVQRVAFVSAVGLVAVVLIDFGDAVWWQTPIEWKIMVAAYNLVLFVVAGLVLAVVIKPRQSAS